MKVLIIGDSSLDQCTIAADAVTDGGTVLDILCDENDGAYDPPVGITLEHINKTTIGGEVQHYSGSTYGDWLGNTPATGSNKGWDTVIFNGTYLAQYNYVLMVLGANDCLVHGDNINRWHSDVSGNAALITKIGGLAVELVDEIEARGPKVIYITEYPLSTQWWMLTADKTTPCHALEEGVCMDRGQEVHAAVEDTHGGMADDHANYSILYNGQLAVLKTQRPKVPIWDFHHDECDLKYGRSLEAIRQWNLTYMSHYTHATGVDTPDKWRLWHLNAVGNLLYAGYIRRRLERIVASKTNYGGMVTVAAP